MAKYKSPGVYIKETSSLPPSINAGSTAIPAFIGYTEILPEVKKNKPVKINSLSEFMTIFGNAPVAEFNVDIKIVNGITKVTSDLKENTSSNWQDYILFYSLKLFYDNGGDSCYIVSVGTFNESITYDALKTGLDSLKRTDEPTLILSPDAVNLANGSEYYNLCEDALFQCGTLKDRFGIFDVIKKPDSSNPANKIEDLDASVFRSHVGGAYLKYGAAYLPFLNTTYNYRIEEDQIQVANPLTKDQSKNPTTSLASLKTTHADSYVKVIQSLKAHYVTLPPSPALAGIYARVDRDRGVWKAPANVNVNAITGLTANITNTDQERLNVDPVSGKSINAIRSFIGKGHLVWGARTLAGNDNEWRYVPVRRFGIMIEESIQKGIAFAVFEPNDANTWAKVKAMIDNFLYGLWQKGALAGAKPESAFFVNVGLGKTMTANDILKGRLIVEVGVAPTRPAEFVILKITQKMQPA